MIQRTRVYLDVCCLNRPMDDLSISRNRLEAEAVVAVVAHALEGDWDIVSSDAVEYELGQCADPVRRQAATKLASAARLSATVNSGDYARAAELVKLGFREFDALHVACAESAQCSVLLSTDDRFLRKAARHVSLLHVRVENPLHWLLEQDDEGTADDTR